MDITQEQLEAAISHAVNVTSLDARLDQPDYEIASRLAPRVLQHLRGETDVQRWEALIPEERARGIDPATGQIRTV